MPSKVMATAHSNLIFYRRNKLLWLIALFFLLYSGLSMIPAFFFTTSQNKLNVLLMAMRTLFFLVKAFVLAMGVLTIWYQIRNRCYKMVVTRPCTPELWMVGNLTSAALVAIVLYAALLVLCILSFMAFKVPIQWGILYLLGEQLAALLVQYSILTLLCLLTHPFMGFLLFLTLNDKIFYYLTTLTSAGYEGAESAIGKVFYGIGKGLFAALYFAIPSSDPYSSRTDAVWQSLRIEPGDLSALALMMLYAVTCSALFFTLACYALRRKNAM